ncbi:nucleoside deaminase [candidate division WOR-3 bacterium]|nr:nucleoside deaminase [candidate division WOR-3 bacterium]
MSKFMEEAIREAELAKHEGEVPVGAVIVMDNRIIGRGHNRVEALRDPTAHAEIIAITSASNFIGDQRLKDAVLYVTLEPCPMCAGAIMLSRIKKCVYGAFDPLMGALETRYKIRKNDLEFIGGILEEECSRLLKDFFRERR